MINGRNIAEAIKTGLKLGKHITLNGNNTLEDLTEISNTVLINLFDVMEKNKLVSNMDILLTQNWGEKTKISEIMFFFFSLKEKQQKKA